MVATCFYFQVHQPFRLRRYGVFDIGRSTDYFDEPANRAIMEKVARRCYLPMNTLLAELIDRYDGLFKVAFSISGTALDQFELYAPEVLESFRRLARTGCVEFLAETYAHSLSFVLDRAEFDRQVDLHVRAIDRHFGCVPEVFRNTELIYGDELARHVRDSGFRAILAEGADHVLGWRSCNYVYRAAGAPDISVLLKNYRLSDDIAFRFGDRGWPQHPLTAPRFARWIDAVNGSGDVVNLFMDYETFGEHQWADTGIFEFMRQLPGEILAHSDNTFKTPGEVARSTWPIAEIGVTQLTSWADTERDLSAWLGNAMQRAAGEALYRLAPAVVAAGDPCLTETFRRLTTSDHLYYMCTKHFADGDVHKYFNPYESPYEAYISFMNVLNDLSLRLGATERGTPGPLAVTAPTEMPVPA